MSITIDGVPRQLGIGPQRYTCTTMDGQTPGRRTATPPLGISTPHYSCKPEGLPGGMTVTVMRYADTPTTDAVVDATASVGKGRDDLGMVVDGHIAQDLTDEQFFASRRLSGLAAQPAW